MKNQLITLLNKQGGRYFFAVVAVIFCGLSVMLLASPTEDGDSKHQENADDNTPTVYLSTSPESAPHSLVLPPDSCPGSYDEQSRYVYRSYDSQFPSLVNFLRIATASTRGDNPETDKLVDALAERLKQRESKVARQQSDQPDVSHDSVSCDESGAETSPFVGHEDYNSRPASLHNQPLDTPLPELFDEQGSSVSTVGSEDLEFMSDAHKDVANRLAPKIQELEEDRAVIEEQLKAMKSELAKSQKELNRYVQKHEGKKQATAAQDKALAPEQSNPAPTNGAEHSAETDSATRSETGSASSSVDHKALTAFTDSSTDEMPPAYQKPFKGKCIEDLRDEWVAQVTERDRRLLGINRAHEDHNQHSDAHSDTTSTVSTNSGASHGQYAIENHNDNEQSPSDGSMSAAGSASSSAVNAFVEHAIEAAKRQLLKEKQEDKARHLADGSDTRQETQATPHDTDSKDYIDSFLEEATKVSFSSFASGVSVPRVASNPAQRSESDSGSVNIASDEFSGIELSRASGSSVYPQSLPKSSAEGSTEETELSSQLTSDDDIFPDDSVSNSGLSRDDQAENGQHPDKGSGSLSDFLASLPSKDKVLAWFSRSSDKPEIPGDNTGDDTDDDTEQKDHSVHSVHSVHSDHGDHGDHGDISTQKSGSEDETDADSQTSYASTKTDTTASDISTAVDDKMAQSDTVPEPPANSVSTHLLQNGAIIRQSADVLKESQRGIDNHSSKKTRGVNAGDEMETDGFWMRYIRSNSHQATRGDFNGFNGRIEGITFGVDSTTDEQWGMGVAFTAAKTTLSAKGAAESSKGEHCVISLYTRWLVDSWFANGVLSYAHGKHDYKPQVDGINRQSSANSNTLGLTLSSGCNLPLNQQWTLQPKAVFSLIKADLTDSKVDSINTHLKAKDTTFAEFGLGASVMGEMPFRTGILMPNAWLMGYYDGNGRAYEGMVVSTTYSERRKGMKPQKTRLSAGMGARYAVDNNLTLGFEYGGDFKPGYKADALRLKFNYMF